MVCERFPIGLEILALEPAALNLFGEQPVDNGMVDMFEEVAVDGLLDVSHHAIGVDQENGHPGTACRRTVRICSEKRNTQNNDTRHGSGPHHFTPPVISASRVKNPFFRSELMPQFTGTD